MDFFLNLCLTNYSPKQCRLFPFIAAAFALKHFSEYFCQCYVEFQMEAMTGGDKNRVVRN
jgi:hypothetical protein